MAEDTDGSKPNDSSESVAVGALLSSMSLRVPRTRWERTEVDT